MAVGGGRMKSRILLGYLDEYMDTNTADCYTSKIGGLPDFPNPVDTSTSQLTCVLCSSSLVLITQIYAPLDNSKYHRTLYLFCCVQPACWNDSRAWKCFRSQLKDTTTSKNTSTISTTSEIFSTTDWCEDADDWGEDANDNNGNVSVSLSTPSPDSPPPPPVFGAVGGLSKQVQNLNIGGKSDPNANSGADDNTGVSGSGSVPGVGDGVTAEIEKDAELEGFVSADMPEVDASHIPGLFQCNNADIPSTGVVVTPVYVWVGEEQDSPQASQHELNLTKQFKAEESDKIDDGMAADTIYEKTLPRHGDELSHKFISTIQKNPGQVLRYARSHQEQPLVFQQIHKNDVVKCKNCGAKLRFEMQLLPTLVNFLETQGIDGTIVEFGTVIVYTCTDSCWTQSDTLKEETVVVQHENM